MPKTTNIEKVKEMAILLLYTDIHQTEFPPIVKHPFFETGYVPIKNEKRIEFLDILNDKDSYQKVISEMKNTIIQAANVISIYRLITKPYRLTFLKFTEKYLSKSDFSEILANAWVNSENPNMDVNVSIAKAISFFRKADKGILMKEEDFAIFNNLPDEFEIFRGVAVGRNPKGISWTRNQDTAEWFSHRFDTAIKKGYIQKTVIKKEDCLAYFNTRGEDEIVADTRKYMIQRI